MDGMIGWGGWIVGVGWSRLYLWIWTRLKTKRNGVSVSAECQSLVRGWYSGCLRWSVNRYFRSWSSWRYVISVDVVVAREGRGESISIPFWLEEDGCVVSAVSMRFGLDLSLSETKMSDKVIWIIICTFSWGCKYPLHELRPMNRGGVEVWAGCVEWKGAWTGSTGIQGVRTLLALSLQKCLTHEEDLRVSSFLTGIF